MTRQTWTAVVSATCFVALAVLLAVVPVPYVTWSPGRTLDTLGSVDGVPMITVAGTRTYPTDGRLDLTTVGITRADSRLSLPQAVAAYWLPNFDALPREAVYPAGTTVEESRRQEAESMDTAQDDAAVAALRAAGQPVTERPAVASVIVGSPAHTRLRPGDLVLSVDGVPVASPQAVSAGVRAHRPGEEVVLVVLRERARTTVRVRSGKSPSDPGSAAVGITVGPGYDYAPQITFDLDKIGGPSAGLIFALAIYDKITAGPLLTGRHVAGTGTITADGAVGAIGGVQEKIAAAESADAEAFLVPAANCGDLAGVSTDLTLIAVATLADGVAAVRTLGEPGGAERVPLCP
jgi:PDZ domain-containing protein